MTPADVTLRKTLVASGIPSAQWESIRAGLRQRAFFSARIESMRMLSSARQTVSDLLSEAQTAFGTVTTRADALHAVRETAHRLGLATGKGGSADPGSLVRARLVVDTNAGLAAGYVHHAADMTAGARAVAPAYELVRLPQSHPMRPRNWPIRWRQAGGRLYDGGRMVALVDDPIWARISRFGCPYPPFDYNSGMTTALVGREEAVRLGVIDDGWKPSQTPPQRGFNEGLDASVDIGHWTGGEFARLRGLFGDQVQFTKDLAGNMTARWSGVSMRELFAGEGAAADGTVCRLGFATSALLSKMPTDELRSAFAGKGCVIPGALKRHMEKHGHWPVEKSRRTNEQLTEAELEILPEVWRNPDRVLAGNRTGTALLELDALDGGVFVLVASVKSGGAMPLTFYKRRAK